MTERILEDAAAVDQRETKAENVLELLLEVSPPRTWRVFQLLVDVVLAEREHGDEVGSMNGNDPIVELFDWFSQ